ncbi:hypothetical protein [Chiayiivirga flava]|uniref:Cobalamin ABC transporter n=1 Tax=Chiayiivirga flava TaxID=659595 RepID=A0A7W8DAB1_9GAMM|nr:hypothetical protein [Chiayiivirga flava]MBB5209461.1 hypothetical protein [Chiayiivirga flava]
MSFSAGQRFAIFGAVALVLAVTRLNVIETTFHFSSIPDASWAMFFVGGFYLRGASRWAFPLLMALAVIVDYIVISNAGLDFWTHYCVTPAYWFLAPSYFALWYGGMLLRRHQNGLTLRTLGLLAATLLVAFSVCFVVSNGSFYWLSDVVSTATFAGWMKNLGDWYLPFLRVTVAYVAIVAVLHAVGVGVTRALGAPARDTRA